MEYLISQATEQKLREKHHVFEHEVIECFNNRSAKILIDKREEHKTDPPTEWFIAETNTGRRLKIIFIQISRNEIVIRTAYQPNAVEEQIYEQNT